MMTHNPFLPAEDQELVSRAYPLPRGDHPLLLKKTRSLCPECNRVLEADIIEEGGQIWLERTCPEHGKSRHLSWSDATLYRRFDRYDFPGEGIANPQTTAPHGSCPASCGLCSNHHSQTLLANIDLTNRCNLDCDFCFANARASGFVYEPSFEEVVTMLQMLRDQKPVPVPAVQFSGGEPTLRDDLAEIIRKARALGFVQIQIATNGVCIANDPELARQLIDAGLGTMYLHFDGVSKRTNPFLKVHKKAIRNLKEAGQGVVLVPTIIKGKNDHEIGDIIRFAVDNNSVVRGINFQPVAFTGAASDEDIRRSRITIPEVLEKIESQTQSEIKKDYFYPVPCVIPFSDLVEAYTGQPQVRFTAHQHCGAATYVFVGPDGSVVPVNRMVDVESLFESIGRIAETLRKGGTINKYTALLEGVLSIHDSVKRGEKGNITEFWKLMGKVLVMQDIDTIGEFHRNALFIGTMHFMDRYNYDLERVSRCCIHYATPDGRLIPFCTYNSGPVYREQVWKKFAKGDT